MCGDGLTQDDVCQNSGTRAFVPKSLGECSDMISAVQSGNPYGAKCPLHDGKELGISHYVEYVGCNAPSGMKYDNFVSSVCTCPAGTCGPKNCGNSGGGGGGIVGGDPHFRTHDGTMYSYHGECDLVMAQSKLFGNGLGLDVHARTAMIANTWSLVSNAVVRIGDDTFELNNNGTHYVNGIADVVLPTTLANEYKIHFEVEHINNGEKNDFQTWYTIDLGGTDGDKIIIINYKKMISVNVISKVPDMVGMLGTGLLTGLVARDGISIVNADEMGNQWQVRDTEGMLFNEIRSPQYPEKCKLPDISMQRRRLRSVEKTMSNDAIVACANVNKNVYDFCLYDVLISGDASLAHTYTRGVF
jgi:von Willebrand factor type D domain